ncbi:MAG: recombinase family protein [Acetobacteraceae bacterium]
MIYAYASVSTDAEDFTGQPAQHEAAGCERMFREKITGTAADGLQLHQLVARLGLGDVVVIPATDRLSLDTTDLLVIAPNMKRKAERGFTVLSVAAKLERRRILERTARGRSDAQTEGVKFARNAKLTPHQQRDARRGIEDGETQRSVARRYTVSQATIAP